MRRKPSATLRANAGAVRGNRGQRSGPQSVHRSCEFCQAIRYLPPPLVPRLAWRCLGMERVMGIEPTLAAWEAAVLPLNYTRVAQIVREGPTTGQCAGASAGAVDSPVPGYAVKDPCGGRLPWGGEAGPPRTAGVSGLDAMSGGARADATGEVFGRGGRNECPMRRHATVAMSPTSWRSTAAWPMEPSRIGPDAPPPCGRSVGTDLIRHRTGSPGAAQCGRQACSGRAG